MSEAKYNAVKGVCSAGFNTNVHPAATAGPILAMAKNAGKFHYIENNNKLKPRK